MWPTQIEMEKEEKDDMNNQLNQLKKEVENLKSELTIAESENMEAEKKRDLLVILYDKKIIDDEGKLI